MITQKIKRYSEAFKHQVVEEYEAGSSLAELARKYGITGGSTIRNWIKKYAKAGFRHEVIRIQSSEEANRVKQLEQQVKDLEQALGKLVLEKMMLESILEELDEAYRETAKKNAATSSSVWSTKSPSKSLGR